MEFRVDDDPSGAATADAGGNVSLDLTITGDPGDSGLQQSGRKDGSEVESKAEAGEG